MIKSPEFSEKHPDFRGSGSFRTERGFVSGFECALFLPASETAKIWILVRARSRSDGPVILDWKFSCELAIGTDVFSAQEIFHSGYIPWNWGDGVEDTLVGDVTRLIAQHGDAQGSGISGVRFVITPSTLLRSADLVAKANGEIVSRKIVRPGPICRASSELAFQFESVYRLGTAGTTESSVQCQLIDPAAMVDQNKVLSSLDDILTLASLAERRVLILTGWHVEYTNGASSTSYRRDFTAASDEETDVDQTLISLGNVGEFLNGSLEKLAGLAHPEILKQAIQFALHGQGRGIGDSFVMLFAGIETLLNLFVSEPDVEPIISKTQWKPLFDLMSSAITTDEGFRALTPEVQRQLLDNVGGANRAYFADRFRRMCSSQKIDLSDLWPMLGGQGSLYAVRNRVVHGRAFASDQEWFRVISAKYHLLWTLERTILRILGWPLERSRVSAQALHWMTLYSGWRPDRDYLAALR